MLLIFQRFERLERSEALERFEHAQSSCSEAVECFERARSYEGEVPQRDIELAIRRKRNFELDPDRYTHKE